MITLAAYEPYITLRYDRRHVCIVEFLRGWSCDALTVYKVGWEGSSTAQYATCSETDEGKTNDILNVSPVEWVIRVLMVNSSSS